VAAAMSGEVVRELDGPCAFYRRARGGEEVLGWPGKFNAAMLVLPLAAPPATCSPTHMPLRRSCSGPGEVQLRRPLAPPAREPPSRWRARGWDCQVGERRWLGKYAEGEAPYRKWDDEPR